MWRKRERVTASSFPEKHSLQFCCGEGFSIWRASWDARLEQPVCRSCTGRTPSPAVHHRSQPHTGAGTLASTHQPPTGLLCEVNWLHRGARVWWRWLWNLLKTQGCNIDVLQVAWVNVRTSPRKQHGRIRATVRATKGVPRAASCAGEIRLWEIKEGTFFRVLV